MEKPTVISTFAGCGGSSLGYQMAGFRELLAVEWDDNAVETFKLNFPDVLVYHGDIAELSSGECMKLAGIKAGELDVLDGSPPCQGFSTAGKRKFDDPRNSLFQHFARLLSELQPKVFVMENVTGMIKGCMKQAYLTIIKTLRDCGYRARGEVLNAMYFNVPQSRERVIIIGVREDLNIEPSHPKPQTRPMNVKEAWKGLTETHQNLMPPVTGKTLQALLKCKQGQSVADFKGSGFSNIRISFMKPCPALLKTLAFNRYPGMFHPKESRGITIDEAKRIASFPDDFIFQGRYGEAWARIGNSVPPNLMKAIAEHIRDEILSKA